ncbi:hypothetical protein BDP81DRAFT_451266 [Colletotrichum phormii]|uniref:Uncharacterized protein n=1 Tax=Colletotrichum phormii TaxID=359342 RepID=A0AAI9ZMN2_9PEZI|nr:uncharacterized protein BDP81DRAFT_451266 [Colletotrichum phormii]KAK1634759.1 hypothetical protein BDP81DRAFT_451266 [Colletotrichum phormii]
MSQRDQTTSSGRLNGLHYSFGTSGTGHSFTWSPPASSGSQNQLNHAELPPEKRRRLNEVQVNFEAEGVAKIRLGEGMTLDFTSNHREAKKKLSDVEAERDQLLQRLDETGKSHEEALSKVKSEREESIRDLREARLLYDRITSASRAEMAKLQQQLKQAKEDNEKTELELENAEDEVERSTIGSLDSMDTEISPLVRTIRYLRNDHSKTLARNNKTIANIKKELQSSRDNHRAVSGLLKMRERELEACRDHNAKRIDGLREFNTKYMGEIGSLRSKVKELQDALDKQKEKTIIEL